MRVGLLARRFLTPGWSLAAVALAATSLLATHFGTQARPHGAAAGMFPLCLWACCLHAQHGRRRTLALVTFTGALTWATLQSALALGFPVLAALWLAPRTGGRPWWWACGPPVAALLLVVALFHPYLLVSDDERLLPLDTWVFNTEAHPLPMFGSDAESSHEA